MAPVHPPSAMHLPALFTPPAPARLAQYLHERFPLSAHGPLVLVFAAASLSGTLAAVPVAALSLLVAFLHLRIADEHKDFWTDARYRRDRPVPRGLVTLAELRAVAWGGVAVQFVAAGVGGPLPLVSLLVVWGYTALMAVEFGNPAWLRARPGLYLATHLGILPVLALHAATYGAPPSPVRLGGLLAAAYAAGVVLEVGRKLRAPADEAAGVETYTAAWGRRRAVAVWAGGIIASGACALPFVGAWGIGLGGLALGALGAGLRFVHRPTAAGARRVEKLSGAWLFALFLLLAAA